MRRPAVVAVLVLAAAVLAHPVRAGAMASHVGWPPYEMLVMNKTDSSRPLDARPGHDPFGGQDPSYSCDELGRRPSSSCGPQFVPAGAGYVVTSLPASHRLLGGHGSDLIHAGPWGDVIWGDYKPCCQPSSQEDRLFGGAGPDFIYASHGRNVISAGAGTDIVHAHFGRGVVDCGPGRDIVYVHGAHPHRYRLRGCEVVSTRTGESAPGWVLRRLPWLNCRKGTAWSYAACRKPGERPHLDLAGADLTGPFDAGALLGDIALRRCQLLQDGDPLYSTAGVAAADDATAALTGMGLGLPAVTPVVGPDGDCALASPPSTIVERFDFDGLFDAWVPVICRRVAAHDGPAAAYADTAYEWARRVVDVWQGDLRKSRLTPEQRQAAMAHAEEAAGSCDR